VTESVVLGAGLTGLAAALRLAEAGHRTCVIERLPVVGGLAGRWRGELSYAYTPEVGR